MWTSIGLFGLAAVVIGVASPRLSGAADNLADVTGLGQTLADALFLGASTSLPELIVSFKTALAGQARSAVLPVLTSTEGNIPFKHQSYRCNRAERGPKVTPLWC